MGRGEKSSAFALGAVLLGICGSLTWHRAEVYSTSASLWRDTVTQNPNSWLAQANIGQTLAAAKDDDDAIAHF